MLNDNKKLRNFLINVIIILSFAVFSALSVFLIFRSHFVPGEWDLDFHWQRIFEMKKDMIEHDFMSTIALTYFHQSGSAVMSMYPKINLFPMVLISFFVKSQVVFFNLLFALVNFFSLLIAYFSSYGFNKNRRVSFIFSISYVLSGIFISNYAGQSSLGTLSSLSYLPLVLFGFLSLLKKDKFIELTLGISAIFLSHVLSFGIVIMFLSFLILFNFDYFKNRSKLISLIKSILVSILISSVFWIPFIMISFYNKLMIPSVSNIQGDDVLRFLSDGFSDKVSNYIGIIAVIGFILSIVYYKALSKDLKKMLWISLIFMIIASNLFPWELLGSTFINHIQYPSRLYIIPQIIFCYIFAQIVIYKTKDSFLKNKIVVILSLVVILLQLNLQKSIINSNINKPEISNPYSFDINFVLKNNSDFNNILNSNLSSSDYYPNSAIPKYGDIMNHVATFNKKHSIKVKAIGYGKFEFNIPNKAYNFTLPFLYYKNINYSISLDGKHTHGYPNESNLMTINNVSRGQHTVQVIVHKSWYDYLSYVLSSLGIVILLYSLIKDYCLKRKNE